MNISISNLQKSSFRIAFLILMIAGVAGVSACGVKSKPGTPEGSTYPSLYPEPETQAVPSGPAPAVGNTYGSGYVRKNRSGSSGYYEPPPAVTDRPLK